MVYSNVFVVDDDAAVRQSVAGYRETIWECSQRGPLDVYYWRLEVDQLREAAQADKKAQKRFEKVRRKATAKDSVRALNKLTDIVMENMESELLLESWMMDPAGSDWRSSQLQEEELERARLRGPARSRGGAC